MPKYIDADLLKSKIGLHSTIQALIDNLPAADVRPITHGHYTPIFENKDEEARGIAIYHKCSVCGCSARGDTYSRELDFEFCPYCSAMMDGKDGNEDNTNDL